MKLIEKISNISLEFFNSEQFINPLPNEVRVYQDNDSHLIDVSFKNGTLTTVLWDGENKYNPTEKEVDYMIDYLQHLLIEEVEKTKKYYNENQYNYKW
tara:strand:+ start:2469 stop:2762 length:294 start_codon:yes stop_codon:yes gene_type:complete